MTSLQKDALGNEDTPSDGQQSEEITGRRGLTLHRRQARRTRRLRIGAVAVAGGLAFFGIAGTSVQNDQLRASLVSLTSPTAAAEAADSTPADEAQRAGGDADVDEQQRTADAAAADEAKKAEEAKAAEEAKEAKASEEKSAAEAQAAAEAKAAEDAKAVEAAAAAEQARLAAEQEAAARAAAEAQAAADRAAEEAAAASVPMDDPAGAKAYAASALAGHGWAASEMTCLNTLWEKESNWMTSATNASSGAYGIVQSLPAEKMASSGGDYLTSYKTQINWGLGYIESRYGSPCSALNFHYANNWY